MTNTDGGPAFPVTSKVHAGYGGDSSGGMSLRDWFAGQALAGLLAQGNAILDGAPAAAYRYADAMLSERNKKP